MNKEELSHKIIDLLWDRRNSLKATYLKGTDSWERHHELKIPLEGGYVTLVHTHPFSIFSRDSYSLIVYVPKYERMMQRIVMKKYRRKIMDIISHYMDSFKSKNCGALSEVVKVLENIKSE